MREMHVQKRSGKKEKVNFDKVLYRIKELSYGLNYHIDVTEVAKRTIDGIYDGVRTSELDALSAQIAASLAIKHHDYSILAARLAISNIHKNTDKKFSDAIKKLYRYKNKGTGKRSPKVSKELYDTVMKHQEKINSAIVQARDNNTLDYFGVKTLELTYLTKVDGQTVERPQYMFMRVALGLHGEDVDAAIETYNLMSQKYFIHATPTLFNAGTTLPQLSSCFLLAMQDDSIKGIYETLKRCARISQYAGGIGLSIHNVRAKNSYIAGSGGRSNGLVPMLRNFNETSRYVDQGGGRRKGSTAIYLEPWHPDIEDFLEMKKNRGAEELRAKDLFYALWIPDLFMKRVEADAEWSLFCPNEAKGLYNLYGEAFEKKYESFEKKGVARKTMKARELWFKILESQIETGTPYMLYKDAANAKSNQQNLGVIRSSNLCCEVIEYTDSNEIAVCNLASIALSRFATKDGDFDFSKLHKITKIVTKNLNKVIDRNFYPLKEAEQSNKKHRPIGMGVQGLADVFAIMKLPFDSLEARKINSNIFETMYHAAVEASCELAEKDGPYASYKGSPISKGIFQFDMWHVVPDSGMWDWEKLRAKVKEHGVRNSLLLALMPTASTAQIFGNNESAEPFTSNLYIRRVLSGEFIVMNKYLLKDLIELNIWNDDIKKELIANNGSVQNIDSIPDDIKLRYRTVWEIPQKSIIDMAADRGAYICQSQSMNIHMQDATASKLTSMHFYAWHRGLKTGMYYLRNTPAREAVKFTVKNSGNIKLSKPIKSSVEMTEINSISKNEDDDPNICLSCGS